MRDVCIELTEETNLGGCRERTENWYLYTKDGDVSRISYNSYTITPMGSQNGPEWAYNNGDNGFEERVKEFIQEELRYYKSKYKRLIKNLNPEVIDKYKIK